MATVIPSSSHTCDDSKPSMSRSITTLRWRSEKFVEPRLGHRHLIEGRVDNGRRKHQPHRPGLLQLVHQLLQRRGARCSLCVELLYGFGVDVVDDAAVSVAHEPAHEICPIRPSPTIPSSIGVSVAMAFLLT